MRPGTPLPNIYGVALVWGEEAPPALPPPTLVLWPLSERERRRERSSPQYSLIGGRLLGGCVSGTFPSVDRCLAIFREGERMAPRHSFPQYLRRGCHPGGGCACACAPPPPKPRLVVIFRERDATGDPPPIFGVTVDRGSMHLKLGIYIMIRCPHNFKL